MLGEINCNVKVLIVFPVTKKTSLVASIILLYVFPECGRNVANCERAQSEKFCIALKQFLCSDLCNVTHQKVLAEQGLGTTALEYSKIVRYFII